MLHQPTRHLAAADQAARILGTFRHVSHVRMDAAAGRAVVVGIRHRLPVEVGVSLEVAEAMRARGVPATVRRAVAS
jgi:hypothetical protein